MSSLSKSAAKALGCETYFRGYYLSGTEQIKHGFTQVGIDFHHFMSAYINHLVDTGKSDDVTWAEDWLTRNPVEAESRDMIEREIPHIRIDHEAVLGTEVFVACDSEFNSLRLVRNPGLGKAPEDPLAYIHGTLDLILSLSEGEVLLIDDWKTGWSGKVDPYESVHYPVLAFSRYPRAKRIRFRWMFTRFGAPIEQWYDRSELPRMQSIVRAKVAERDAATLRFLAEKPSIEPEVNPFAGLCGYCGLTCRIRQMDMDGEAISAPLQTPDDAKEATGRILALRPVLSHLEEALRSYLTTNGPLEGLAQIKMSATTEVPLVSGLEALGCTIDSSGAKWDVPLDKLRIGFTDLKSYAKAKKRAGMAEAIDAIAVKTPKATLSLT